jgi:hypothetical protein
MTLCKPLLADLDRDDLAACFKKTYPPRAKVGQHARHDQATDGAASSTSLPLQAIVVNASPGSGDMPMAVVPFHEASGSGDMPIAVVPFHEASGSGDMPMAVVPFHEASGSGDMPMAAVDSQPHEAPNSLLTHFLDASYSDLPVAASSEVIDDEMSLAAAPMLDPQEISPTLLSAWSDELREVLMCQEEGTDAVAAGGGAAFTFAPTSVPSSQVDVPLFAFPAMDRASVLVDAATQTEPTPVLYDASKMFPLDATAQRFVIAKLHLLSNMVKSGFEALAAAPPSRGPIPDSLVIRVHDMYRALVMDFMRSAPDWTWRALFDGLRRVKTTSSDRSSTLAVMLLRVVAIMMPQEDEVLLPGIPMCLPPAFPQALRRELTQLLGELRQPYRREQFFEGNRGEWMANQIAVSFLQQQLLGIAALPDLMIAYEEAVDGLQALVDNTIGVEEAWLDVAALLIKAHGSDALRFAQNWDKLQDESLRTHLVDRVQQQLA